MEGRPSPTRAAAGTAVLPTSPTGQFVELEGETYYRISAFDRLAPFLMSLPSESDLWMFVTSGGGLTAGRIDAQGSLFPYRTVDQLHDSHHHTGPLTLLRIDRRNGESVLWEPFTTAQAASQLVARSLYKNTIGNRLIFEEARPDLGLTFRYRWSACDEFGWVRTATLENRSDARVSITLLDGLRNVLPFGAPLSLYQQASNLVDAYKKSEVDAETGLGIFSLTAGITDRAEALEILRANTVWCCGLQRYRVSLSRAAVDRFRSGGLVPEVSVLNGARGHYFVLATLDLDPRESTSWHLCADAGLDHARIAALRHRLLGEADLGRRVEESLWRAREGLWRNVASADGLQLCGRTESWCHHFANVLFNNMRGGVFLRNYDVPVADLVAFLRVRDRSVADRQHPLLSGLPATSTIQEIGDLAHETGDADFERLALEYLPLYFARRHGDPSRPWNQFTIRVRNRMGERELHYEGNWRDIFQNWEALGAAFPRFLPGMVAKFVNASTVDGFNPYRITRDGVDWEVVSPDDPWSNIGYWGDHQIVYLLRLLEAMDRYDPTALGRLLGAPIFSYAEVPYRIRPYEEILRDPSSTIEFDRSRAARIEERVRRRGTDGKLLMGPDGSVHHANLLEKLLVPALSKLSNLIPGAGIWMNTQRPEWNDANNALAGGGVSVVTLCHLRRYLAFLEARLGDSAHSELPISREIADWLDRIGSALQVEQGVLAGGTCGARDRKRLMDVLGRAFSDYRERVYAHGFSGTRTICVQRVLDLCHFGLRYIEHSIAANRRQDGLFNSYNLLELADPDGGAEVVRLPEMLEGQVAVLSSGALGPQAALDLLQRLFHSALHQPARRSFLLYPERVLPGFLAKNVVPDASVEAIPLLRDLLAAKDRSLLVRDAGGVCRFQGDFHNVADVAAALDELGKCASWAAAARRDRAAILELFETVFRHKSYTGRSGVMYGYEGLGCIYWHMVAKLLLAVQENVVRAGREGLPASVQGGLVRMYLRIRSGLGYQKPVAEFGAFPTDPYSHTPPHGGAEQPGMTGQVKEEFLARMGELGVHIESGSVCFEPVLLGADEFLASPATFRYVDVHGDPRAIPLPAASLAFTFCQVPVVYQRVPGAPWIRIAFADGTSVDRPGTALDSRLSAQLFDRGGRIDHIAVGIPDRDRGVAIDS